MPGHRLRWHVVVGSILAKELNQFLHVQPRPCGNEIPYHLFIVRHRVPLSLSERGAGAFTRHHAPLGLDRTTGCSVGHDTDVSAPTCPPRDREIGIVTPLFPSPTPDGREGRLRLFPALFAGWAVREYCGGQTQVIPSLRTRVPATARDRRDTNRRSLSLTRIPIKFAHVVYRTRRFEEVIGWYETVFGARVQHQNPAMAFLT